MNKAGRHPGKTTFASLFPPTFGGPLPLTPPQKTGGFFGDPGTGRGWPGLLARVSACLYILSVAACKPEVNPQPEPEPEPQKQEYFGHALKSMSVKAGEWTLECEIDTLAGTILLPAYDEDLPNLKSTTAEFSLSEGASIVPDPSQPKDYRKGASFIVTGEDGGEQIYSLSVKMLETPQRPAKPVVMWIDAANSLGFLNTPEKVADVVKTAWDNGFSGIVMDVKSPVSGDVLYAKSDFLGYCTTVGSKTVPQSFDLLQELVDRCHAQGMTISASVSVMTFPRPQTSKGQAYYDENLDQAATYELLPEGIVDSRGDSEAHYKMLNPAHPATRAYAIRMVSELARNYDLDGIALDYCRYLDVRSDFSDYSRSEFEKWSGSPVVNWPDDIISYSGTSRDSYSYGPRIKEWIKWRSSVIQGVVKDCRDAIKAVKPSIKLEYWAESWWWDCYMKGQNWASQKAPMPSGYIWAAPDYMSTGFAEYLDIFHLGMYVKTVYGYGSQWTMEYLANYGRQRNAGACTLYGSFGAYTTGLDFTDATIFNYRSFEGMMIFELGSVRNRWGIYKTAIRKAMRLEGEYK